MSGIELNELMTKVSNGSNAISNFEPVQKPYNRELWRIDNGILEEDLVNFVLDKSQKKIDQLGDIHRKITITLYKEDWIELVTKLKEKLNRIIDNNNKYEWASNIKITHQLCSQKYRNLKKVYIQSKMSSRKKFSYKEQFRQIEELHQMANEKYSSFCDERARMQIHNGATKMEPHQFAPAIQFKSLSDSFIPSSFDLDLTNASPVLSNQKLAETEAIKLEHDDCKIEEIEEMQSESSLTERSRSPIQIVFPEEAPGKSPSEPVDFFIKRESPPGRQSPPSKKESPIQSQLLQNIQNIVNLNNTLNPSFAAFNAASAADSTATNINDDTKSPPVENRVLETIKSISTNLSELSSASAKSFTKISSLLEKQNEMLKESNRLNMERLKIEQDRFELEKQRFLNLNSS